MKTSVYGEIIEEKEEYISLSVVGDRSPGLGGI
jgi:hypothetical protein